ncbi:HNH endonuclease [Lachnospiraceae bacterium OttesenSCG-928-J05]|nr:HNH endonuclease [Lachnospiraceae bacterium OttesenSCG-928-J05]
MQLPYSDELEIKSLSRLFDKTSECYKFFWFQAIITKVLEGQEVIAFTDLIDEMVTESWYMVTEYHLNLGPKDSLEALVKHLRNISGLKPSEKKSVILEYLKKCDDKEVLRLKRVLTLNVPYRLQSPFLSTFKTDSWKVRPQVLAERINREKNLFYYFTTYDGLQTAIKVQPEWLRYIHQNQEILKGWLQYNMIRYLQKRNPSVPGIADKLSPPQTRKLGKVINYWKLILELQPVYEIYSGCQLEKTDISIDHFVPWSYVAHDEFWNLHPTTKSINSSKSNSLPDWNKYFQPFCQQEFRSYQLMQKNAQVHKAFESCAKEHINNEEVKRRVYRAGQSYTEFSKELEEVVLPVYMSAENCGFSNWVYEED